MIPTLKLPHPAANPSADQQTIHHNTSFEDPLQTEASKPSTQPILIGATTDAVAAMTASSSSDSSHGRSLSLETGLPRRRSITSLQLPVMEVDPQEQPSTSHAAATSSISNESSTAESESGVGVSSDDRVSETLSIILEHAAKLFKGSVQPMDQVHPPLGTALAVAAAASLSQRRLSVPGSVEAGAGRFRPPTTSSAVGFGQMFHRVHLQHAFDSIPRQTAPLNSGQAFISHEFPPPGTSYSSASSLPPPPPPAPSQQAQQTDEDPAGAPNTPSASSFSESEGTASSATLPGHSSANKEPNLMSILQQFFRPNFQGASPSSCGPPLPGGSLPWTLQGRQQQMQGLNAAGFFPGSAPVSSAPLFRGHFGSTFPSLSSHQNPSDSLAGPQSRPEVKKCRKVYGIENRNEWCNQCKWKKACRRFPQPNLTRQLRQTSSPLGQLISRSQSPGQLFASSFPLPSGSLPASVPSLINRLNENRVIAEKGDTRTTSAPSSIVVDQGERHHSEAAQQQQRQPAEVCTDMRQLSQQTSAPPPSAPTPQPHNMEESAESPSGPGA